MKIIQGDLFCEIIIAGILIDDFSYIPLHMILHFDPQENLHRR